MTTTSFEITNMAKKKNTMLFKSEDTDDNNDNKKVRQTITLSNRSPRDGGLYCADIWRTLLVLSLCVSLVSSEVVDLCNVDGCVCANNPSRDDLIDVNCQCQSGQTLLLGPSDAQEQVAVAPDSPIVAQLTISGCQQLEILTKTFNSMVSIQNVTLRDMEKVILHSRLYESRVGNGDSMTINNIDIENIQNLEVKRHTFEGIRVNGTFSMTTVTVERTPSLAFAFDFVNELSIMRSRFDRISMWGFKLTECREFNVVAENRFYALASRAFHMKCNRIQLTNNIFSNLQDASLSVTYGMADIQGNTFEKLTGKPFVDLRPLSEIEDNVNQAQSGLIFDGNKFACEPTLPFNAMAMPSFDKLAGSYVRIDNNHFVCECDRVAWLVASMTRNFDRDIIANGRGSLEFLQKVYDTAGKCLKCGLRKCDIDETTSFHEFARKALIVHNNELKCSASGQALKSQNPDREVNFYKGEEESYADASNQLMNVGSTKSALQFLTSIIVVVFALKIIA